MTLEIHQLVDTLLLTTAWAIGLWVVVFVIVAQLRGKIDQHTWSIPLWVSIISWIIVVFIKEFW